MSTLFCPNWRTRRTRVDFGYAPETNPENPNKPLETPYSGFSGAFRGSVPNLTPLSTVATVTAKGNQEITTVTGATITCFSCWGTDFWQGTGAVVCRRCHPPAPGAEVLTFSRTGPDAPRPVEIERGGAA